MLEGAEVNLFTIRRGDCELQLSEYGASLVSLRHAVTRGSSDKEEITLNYTTLPETLEKNKAFYGGTIGRVANRIAKGRFSLDGKVSERRRGVECGARARC